MAYSVEERVAMMEGQMQQFPQMFSMLRADISRVDGRLDRMDGRLERLEERMSRQFTWTVGIQVTTLLAVVGALLSRG